MANNVFYKLGEWSLKKAGVNISEIANNRIQYLIDKPAWLSLSNPHELREAVSSNPVLNGCIDILSRAASNGNKYITDIKGNEISWDKNTEVVKKLRKLFLEAPNPFQSPIEFNFERYFMFFTFGNNFVYLNNPLESFETDIMTVQTIVNLPSEYTEIRQTGKYYDQVELKGLVEKYIVTNENPPREFINVDNIIHFNELNTSNIGRGLIGVSKLVSLKYPITNTQLAFEAMNVILKTRGMQGIIKTNTKDAQGSQIVVNPKIKEEIEKTFNKDYGITEGQNPFMVTYADVEYIKTIMNSKELGIYEEFSNNAMIISNGLNVPPELYKTYTTGATFENQIQSVRRLYQNTVIPLVKNEDQYWTNRLKLRKYGIELHTDWSHIEALQEAFKDKAAALSMNVSSAEKAYNQNIITVNQYLDLMEQPQIANGNLYKNEYEKSFKPVNEQILQS
jgi:phage portal protein BeeE